jgi:hypothetical protein
VSLKWNAGPVVAQITMMSTAIANVAGRPAMRDVHLAMRLNRDLDRIDIIGALSIGMEQRA